jgi:carboxypeptidase PM20D1
MRRILKWFLVAILCLLIPLVVRTFSVKSKQIQVTAVEKIKLDSATIVDHLAGALKIQTISFDDRSKLNRAEFQKFHDYLRQIFPLVHSHLSRELVKDYSLLYRWNGEDQSLPPIVLMAHMDVVPTESTPWKHPAFSGEIADGYLWGRGTLDDKSNVISQLESAEYLLQSGFKPKRTVYFAFGHDEESGGTGAAAIVQLLQSRGVKPEMVVDEGGAILEAMIPGLPGPAAMIGTSEKGYTTLELILDGQGGHSSAPPKHTLIGEMSEAVRQLENHQMPAKLEGSAAQMLDYLAPEISFSGRFFLGNRWFFQPLITFGLSKMELTNAMVRTTTASTMIQGGVKENVLPSHVVATINFRIRPGETVEDVIAHVRKTIENEKIKIVKGPNGMNPSPISSADSPQFQMLHRTIREVYDSVIVLPGIVIGATDARHYSKICDNVFRFSPFRVSEEDFHGVHGTNERIRTDNYVDMVRFYVQFLRNAAK